MAEEESVAEENVTKSRVEGTTKKFTLEAWRAEAVRRFGKDSAAWKFVCPSCGHVVSVGDYKKAGAPEDAVAFSCIGRYLEKRSEAFKMGQGPCNYAGGGLFRINPVAVLSSDGEEHYVFDFAEEGS